MSSKGSGHLKLCRSSTMEGVTLEAWLLSGTLLWIDVHVYYSLNSLKGDYIGDNIGDYYRDY